MCIIIYGKVKDILETGIYPSWSNNSDGAGIAYETKRGIYYQKGFMQFQDIMKFVSKLRDERYIALHFRITTHGGTSKELTHPFPVCNNLNKMRQLAGTHKAVVFHNGVLNYLTPVGISDSMKLAYHLAYYNDENLIKTVKFLTGVSDSKYLLWTKEHGPVFAGIGWVKENNVWFSNNSYSFHSKKTYTYYSGHDKSYSDYYDTNTNKTGGRIIPFNTNNTKYPINMYATSKINVYRCPICDHDMEHCYSSYHYCFNCDSSWQNANGFFIEEEFQTYSNTELNNDDGPIVDKLLDREEEKAHKEGLKLLNAPIHVSSIGGTL